MTKTTIRFKTKLLRPAESEKTDSWTFLILPKSVSAKLPSRGMTAVEGTINGVPFQAVLARLTRYENPKNRFVLEHFQKHVAQASVEPFAIKRRHEFVARAFDHYLKSKGEILSSREA